jgi:hypothetical protein
MRGERRSRTRIQPKLQRKRVSPVETMRIALARSSICAYTNNR